MSTKRVEIIFDSKILGRVDVERLTQSADKLNANVSKFGALGESESRRAVTAVDRVKAAYDRLHGAQKDQAATASRVFEAARQPAQAAANALQGLISRFSGAGLVAGAAAVGMGTFVQQAISLVHEAGNAAEAMANLAERTGLTIGQVDKLQAMAKIAGVNVQSLESSARILSETLSDSGAGGEKALRALQKLGISTFDATGKQRELGQVTLELIERLSRISNVAERNALATATLGRSSKELLPLIKQFKELDAAVTRMGFGQRDEMLQGLAAAGDKVDELGLKWDLLKGKLANKLTAVVEITNKTVDFFDSGAAGTVLNMASPRGLLSALFGSKFTGTAAAPAAPTTPSGTGTPGDQEAARKRGEEFSKRFANTLEGLQARLKDVSGKIPDAILKARSGVPGAESQVTKLTSEKANLEDAISRTRRENPQALAKQLAEKLKRAQQDIQEFSLKSLEKFAVHLKDATASALAGSDAEQLTRESLIGLSEEAKAARFLVAKELFGDVNAVLPKEASALVDHVAKAFNGSTPTPGVIDQAIATVRRDLDFSLSQILGERFEQRARGEAEALSQQLEQSSIPTTIKKSIEGLGLSSTAVQSVVDAQQELIAVANRTLLALRRDVVNLSTGKLFGSGRISQGLGSTLPGFNPSTGLIDIKTNANGQPQNAVDTGVQFGRANIDAVSRATQFTQQLAQLTAVQGGEVSAILRAAQIRIDGAQKQFEIEKAIHALNKEAVDLTEARIRNESEADQARKDAALQLVELRKREREEFKQGAERLFDAARANGVTGIKDFARSTLVDSTFRKISGNAAGLSFDFFKDQKLAFPGQGTPEKPSLLGRLLQGTPFGLDPTSSLKDVNLKQIESTTDNTAAIEILTAAIGGGLSASSSFGAPSSLRLPSTLFEGGPGLIQSLLPGGRPSGTTVQLPPAIAAAQKEQIRSGLEAAGMKMWTAAGPFRTAGGRSSVAGALFDSNAFNRDRIASGAATAGVLVGAGFGIKSGIQQGGAKGTLTAVSSGLAAAAALNPEPISKAVLATLATITSAATLFFGDPKLKRDKQINDLIQQSGFAAPVSTAHELDLMGRNVDFDTRGQARPFNPNINISINALDSQSIFDRRRDIAHAMTAIIHEGNPFIHDLEYRLSTV